MARSAPRRATMSSPTACRRNRPKGQEHRKERDVGSSRSFPLEKRYALRTKTRRQPERRRRRSGRHRSRTGAAGGKEGSERQARHSAQTKLNHLRTRPVHFRRTDVVLEARTPSYSLPDQCFGRPRRERELPPRSHRTCELFRAVEEPRPSIRNKSDVRESSLQQQRPHRPRSPSMPNLNRAYGQAMAGCNVDKEEDRTQRQWACTVQRADILQREEWPRIRK